MARPKEPKEPKIVETKDKKLCLSMTPSFYAKVKEYADEEGMSFNSYVAYVLRHWHLEHKKKI